MSNYRSSARNFFKEHNVNKEKARKIVEQKTANDRKILETLDADTEILNLDTWKIGNDISNVLEKVVIKSLSLLKGGIDPTNSDFSNLEKIPAFQFKFNDVKILVHPSEMIKELEHISNKEDLNTLITAYIDKKRQEYFDNLGVDCTLDTTATQAYLEKKEREERIKKEREHVVDTKEQEKALPALEFRRKQLTDYSRLVEKHPELLDKYHIVLNEDGMAEVEAETIWNIGLDINQDSYGRGVYIYAERRAKFMQAEIEKGKSVAEVAGQLSHDVDIEGITGFMYGCAVSILSQVRKYGEELKKWHNKKYNHEGEGVANPALLTITTE